MHEHTNRTTKVQGGIALLLFWLSLVVFFCNSLDADVNNPGSLWVLTAFIYYPVFILALVQFITWKVGRYRVR